MVSNLVEACSRRLSAILQNFSQIAQTVYREMCVTKVFHLLSLGANPWAKVHQKGDNLLPTEVYHPAKFHRPASTHVGDIPYEKILQTKLQAVNDILSMPIGI